MNVELVKEYRFEAAHRLPQVPPEHKCSRLHGHSFRFELSLFGAIDARTGWFIDYGDLDDKVAPTLARLDHHYLNEVPGLENPTSELLAVWLWNELRPVVPGLVAVTLFETTDARCVYRGT